jgi:cytochrome d ubiquinol oxidase subunit II
VGFNFRKIADPRWRALWDWTLSIGGFVPSFVFGVAFGNLLLGVPFSFDGDSANLHRQLLRPPNPFGILAVAMLATHGGTWTALKADGAVAVRAACVAGVAVALLFALAGIWIAYGIEGYAVSSARRPVEPARQERGARGGRLAQELRSLADRGIGHRCCRTATGGAIGAPRRRPSCLPRKRHGNCGHHRHRWHIAVPVPDAVLAASLVEPHGVGRVQQSAHAFIMLIAVIMFLPIVLVYTGFVLRVMRGPVRIDEVERRESLY